MNRLKHSLLPLFRAIFVSSVFVLLILSMVNSNLNTASSLVFSVYGLFILLRTILQLVFAHKNNSKIRTKIRQMILDAAEQKMMTPISQQQKNDLLNQPDFRIFRQKLQQILSEKKLDWQSLIQAVFTNLGYDSAAQLPPVFIEIPIFRPESFAEVESTLHSLQSQSYPAIQEILICFNDPTNVPMEKQICSYIQEQKKSDPRLAFLSLPTTSKRAAMHAGFLRHISFYQTAEKDQKSQVISVNIDGDTQVDSDAVTLGVLLLLLDPKTTAITSNVEIRNQHHNWLSLITAARYKSANIVERAAQSCFYSVRCMSGPYMMFWTKNLISLSPRGKPIATEWVTEKFLNVKVEPGDDRSLTVRHNEQGFGVQFHPDILVTTDCPMSWQRWCKQQLRWMRSCNRNFIISLPFLFQMPLFVIFDDLYLFFFPFLLIFCFTQLFVHAFQQSQSLSTAIAFLLPYFAIIFVIQLLKSIHLSYTQKNWKFMYLSSYFLIYFRYLIWLRFISLLTITRSEWAGRTAADFAADQIVLKGGHM